MVLYCVPKLRLMGQKFSVRERIDIAGMEVRLQPFVQLHVYFYVLILSYADFLTLLEGSGKRQAERPSRVHHHRQTALTRSAGQVIEPTEPNLLAVAPLIRDLSLNSCNS